MKTSKKNSNKPTLNKQVMDWSISNNPIKMFSLIVALIVFIDFILLVFHRINEILFWGIIIVAAIYAYYILPKMRKKVP